MVDIWSKKHRITILQNLGLVRNEDGDANLLCVTHSRSVPRMSAPTKSSTSWYRAGPRGLMGIKWRRYQASSTLHQFVINPPDRWGRPQAKTQTTASFRALEFSLIYVQYKSQKNKCTSSVWYVEEEEKHSLIAHIGHDCHDRPWCSFFRPVPLVASKTLDFGLFWPFCHELMHFLVPLVQA